MQTKKRMTIATQATISRKKRGWSSLMTIVRLFSYVLSICNY
ncbi:MAG: hypothetical protein Q8N36_06365 [bacterium]|nr:hypothetical protein [bacterium]